MSLARSVAATGRPNGVVGHEVGAPRCPRCAQRGGTVPYWRRPRRLAAAVGLSMLTYGIGGLVFHAVCARRRFCPSCGLGRSTNATNWTTPATSTDLHDDLFQGVGASEIFQAASQTRLHRLLRAGLQVGRVALLPAGIWAVLDATIGIADGDLRRFVGRLAPATFFGFLLVVHWKMLEGYRQVTDHVRRHKVLKLANRGGGVLTVTEVATELELGLDAAEDLMTDMDDGFRVRTDASDDGVICYEFPEVIHQKKLRAPSAQHTIERRPSQADPPDERTSTPQVSGGGRTSRGSGAPATLARFGRLLATACLRDPLVTLMAAGFVLFALDTTIGIIDQSISGVVNGGLMAAACGFGFRGLRRLKKEGSPSLLESEHACVRELTEHRRGILTVTEVAAELDLGLPEAEQLLIAMDDGSRVRSEISDEGVIYYEFPEFLGREERNAPN